MQKSRIKVAAILGFVECYLQEGKLYRNENLEPNSKVSVKSKACQQIEVKLQSLSTSIHNGFI